MQQALGCTGKRNRVTTARKEHGGMHPHVLRASRAPITTSDWRAPRVRRVSESVKLWQPLVYGAVLIGIGLLALRLISPGSKGGSGQRRVRGT
jgi:hypothetical protein